MKSGVEVSRGFPHFALTNSGMAPYNKPL